MVLHFLFRNIIIQPIRRFTAEGTETPFDAVGGIQIMTLKCERTGIKFIIH